MRDDVKPYEALITNQPLQGLEPDVIVIDKQSEFFLSIKDAARVLELSSDRVRGLVREKRLEAKKPGGRDSFISLSSIGRYLEERKPPGRPHKDSF